MESVEIQKQDFPSFHPPWKSLRDFHISTGPTTGLYSQRRSTKPSTSVTHVVGPNCYPCPRPHRWAGVAPARGRKRGPFQFFDDTTHVREQPARQFSRQVRRAVLGVEDNVHQQRSECVRHSLSPLSGAARSLRQSPRLAPWAILSRPSGSTPRVPLACRAPLAASLRNLGPRRAYYPLEGEEAFAWYISCFS